MFSVLMSLYHRERPEFAEQALASLTTQTVAPAEVVLVKDGSLTAELDAVVERFRDRLPLTVVALPRNIGLARALNEGLAACSQPWVMRFDTDDICVPTRVERQRDMAATGELDLFGAQISEFWEAVERSSGERRVPATHPEIERALRGRNPFNHQTVCYRTQMARDVGGYPLIHGMEDWAMWAVMLRAGARAANLPEVLVHARAGPALVRRRGGAAYVRSNWQLMHHLHRLGWKGGLQMLAEGAARTAFFLLPGSVRELGFRAVRRWR